MRKLKLAALGESLGVILPKEILERLRVEAGDVLYVLETPKGIELTPFDPDIARQIDVAESVLREDREALKKLAE
jgi:putative addiction module antidote